MVVGPCIDDTDFKTLEEAIAYNAAGMDVSLIVEKTDGTTAVTAITLTTAGTSDWTHKDGGYYEIEVTAAQNAEEGIAYIRGVCTGVLPFESPRYDIVKANVYDSWIKGTDVLQTDVTQWLGSAVTANVAGQPTVDVTRLGAATAPLIDLVDFASNGYDSTNNVVFSDVTYIHGSALTESVAGYLAAAFIKLFDVATPLLVASDVMRGTDSAYTGTPPTAAAIVNEWEIQSQADPTGFHVNVLEIGGTAQTANDNGADINEILLDTAVIGALGAGLTAVPWNPAWDAEVESEVNDGLVAFFTSADQLVDDIWDELLTGATHNIATSAGRRVREIGAYAIHSGTAQGGNTIHITLAATASATDGIYNRNLLVIVGGTGAGQTRTIVDYVGATKVALADREWRVSPDATSEYQIVPDDTPLVADHGLARAGTVNTIQLRTYASAVDSIYNGAIIAIIAGTGRGESRIVESYVGATRTATVCDNWDVTPDITSVYVMMPYGMAAVVCIGAEPLADIKTQVDSALSDVHLDDLIQLALTVNDGAPNAADFVTSSAVAVNDWYNGVVLLFTSGALAGIARRVDDYDSATKRIYLENAFPQAPANGNQFVIVGIEGLSVTPETIADAIWDELEAGHTIAGSFGDEVTRQGKKLDRNFIWELIQQSK